MKRITIAILLFGIALSGCRTEAGEKVRVWNYVMEGKKKKTVPDASLRESNCVYNVAADFTNTGVDRGAFADIAMEQAGEMGMKFTLTGRASQTNALSLLVNGVPVATYPVVSNRFQSYWTPKGMPSIRRVYQLDLVRSGDEQKILTATVKVK